MNKHEVVIAVLAAGASRRLGRPKQLLPLGDTTLLRRSAQTALDAACGPVLVVLGSDAEAMQGQLNGLSLSILRNDDWPEGMSSSIRLAVRQTQVQFPFASALLLMLCDQPNISQTLLRQVVAPHQAGQKIVACQYANTVGVPALFARRFWDDLLALRGDHGAKRIIEANRAIVGLVPFPGGEFDIDSPGDAATSRPT